MVYQGQNSNLWPAPKYPSSPQPRFPRPSRHCIRPSPDMQSSQNCPRQTCEPCRTMTPCNIPADTVTYNDTHVCTYTIPTVYVYVQIHLHIYIDTQIHRYIYAYMHICIYTYIHVDTYTCITHTHIYIYKYVHICTHICMCCVFHCLYIYRHIHIINMCIHF